MYIYGAKVYFFRKLVAFLLLKCQFYAYFYVFYAFKPLKFIVFLCINVH